MSILTLGRKQRKESSRSKIERNQRKKIPNQDWKQAKKKRKKNSRSKIERKQNIQKGLSTKQYLNNTELSQVNKKRKETMTWSGPLPLIANQNPVRLRLSRPTLNKNRKGKCPNTQSQIPHQNTIPEKDLLIHDHACNL